MMRRCKRSISGSPASSSARSAETLLASAKTQEMSQRVVDQTSVVVVAAPVVNQVHGGVALLIGDPVHRQDLRGVHDGGVESGLHAPCRNTELSTCRAAGLSPNETLRRPAPC